jgi:tRNA A-37 threonylcarbamoyl transferase component Bud32
MTFRGSSFTRTIHRTTAKLKERFWIWPIIALVILSIIAWGVHSAIESTMRENLRSQLQTLRDVEVAMLRTWLASQESNVESLANQSSVRKLTHEILAARGDHLVEASGSESKAIDQLRIEFARVVAPVMSSHDYTGFVLASHTGEIVASTQAELISRNPVDQFREWVARALDGQPTVSVPFRSETSLLDNSGKSKTGVPTMFCAAPIRDDNFQVIAVLGMRIRPDREFTRILQLGRIGDSGETYAFDKAGVMVSNSRFDDDLILLGLLPDHEGTVSLLNLQVRDPGVNMTEGLRPNVRRAELPLTRMAESSIAGRTDIDVDGYNDYRGVPVVGAWTWLPEYGFGITTESDVAEAYRPLTILKLAFWTLMFLLVVSSLGLFAFAVVASRLQREARQAAIEAKQLGQYKLEEKLGQGAMGVVYRGHHAMLRRETAIKLLDHDKLSETSIARFEREVQTTSGLNHPNTIAVYDYGRTPEGVFYYAMEFLDGIELQDLVDQYGKLSAARTIYLLNQICGSLYEAHSQGLVHRDIKPANIMVNQRGGQSDVIKVLDFGLVIAKNADASNESQMAGTPLYMSPEAFQAPGSVDACSDLYAVGAVGFFMLTGKTIFEAGTFEDLRRKQISEVPKPPSKIDASVPEDLESVLLACLEKERSRRPQSARELAQRLQKCKDFGRWDSEDADRWWTRHSSDRQHTSSDASPTVRNEFAATMDTNS